jgi:hypothetical protein
MPSLREIQTGFAAALFNPAASRQAPGIRAGGISPALRLRFYRTNVFENYRKALGSSYPAVQRLIGTGMFGAIAQEYIRRYHSHSGDVGEHGAHFAEFIAKHPVVQQLPYLADVARLEWCMETAFNEADPRPLPLERLGSIAPDLCGALRFMIAPSARLFSSRYPVDRIWAICQPGGSPEELVDLDDGAVDLLVRRDGFAVVLHRLDRAEHAMLSALASGYAFAEAFEYARALAADFEPGTFLQRHLASGVLADFALPADAV